jgi:hypothetical protein
MVVTGESKLSFEEARLEISRLLDAAMVIALEQPECNERLAKGETMFAGNRMCKGDLVVNTIMASEEVLRRMWEARNKELAEV